MEDEEGKSTDNHGDTDARVGESTHGKVSETKLKRAKPHNNAAKQVMAEKTTEKPRAKWIVKHKSTDQSQDKQLITEPVASNGSQPAPPPPAPAVDKEYDQKKQCNGQMKEKPHPENDQSPLPPPATASASEVSRNAPLPDWRESAWFVGSNGDFMFAQWLFGRCQGVGDLKTPESLTTVQRLYPLYLIQKKIRLELQAVPSADAEEGGDDNDMVNEEKDEEIAALVDDDALPAESGAIWTVNAIFDEVATVVRPSRMHLLEQHRTALAVDRKKQRSEVHLERIVLVEVIENTTELLLSRATWNDRAVLKRWKTFLQEELKNSEKEEETDSKEDAKTDEQKEMKEEVSLPVIDGQVKSGKKARRERKRQKLGPTAHAEQAAIEQINTFLKFLEESRKKTTSKQSVDPIVMPMVENTFALRLNEEVHSIYGNLRIEPSDEARRLEVTHELQRVIRRDVSKWRCCELMLFGSSLSLYGSKNSDADMCLLANGSNALAGDISASIAVSTRELRHLMKNNGASASPGEQDEKAILVELFGQVGKSVEKVALALNGMEIGGYNAGKSSKQHTLLVLFERYFRMLREAIKSKLLTLMATEEELKAVTKASAAVAAERLKLLKAETKRRCDDLFRLRAVLDRAKCEVRLVLSGARIPIIRFQHTPSQMECDLCFENVLAARNTFLLRAYASFDERARMLGVAIKHWAKQRAINDASTGFLSSYSYVLLSIYFLQRVVGILPNLQHPQLLAAANIPPHMYNNVNIAFCEDQSVARDFHKRHPIVESSNEADSLSISSLLVGFFAFYATQFDFARQVVTIRSPEVEAEKSTKWGVGKAKSWRISIEDPLEVTRDLGCVLQFKGQEKIFLEFQRAHDLLTKGESFSTNVCASTAPSPPKSEQKGAQQGKPDKQNIKKDKEAHKNEEKIYVVTLWSDDEELTKAKITQLFKAFEASFRVGRIGAKFERLDSNVQSTAAKNKKWRTELITRAMQCPRALNAKTRVDWSDDNTTGMVWLHHQSIFPNVPCTKCLSPLHAVSNCDVVEADNGAKDKSHRHVLKIILGSGAAASAKARKQSSCKKRNKHKQAKSNGTITEGTKMTSKSPANSEKQAPTSPSSKKLPRGEHQNHSGRRKAKDSRKKNNDAKAQYTEIAVAQD